MPYETSGSLTTDSREVAVDATWDSQTEWEQYQAINNAEVVSGSVQLAEITALDNFEDGDLQEYSGDAGSYSVVQSPVWEGSNALQGSRGADPAAITRTDYSLAQGDSFQVYHNSPDAADSNFLFGVQSATGYANIDCYGIGIYQRGGGNNEIQISRFSNGSESELGNTIVPGVPDDQWLRVRVDWSETGTIDVTVTDMSDVSTVDTLNVNDTSYTSGGFGFRINNGQAHWDLVERV